MTSRNRVATALALAIIMLGVMVMYVAWRELKIKDLKTEKVSLQVTNSRLEKELVDAKQAKAKYEYEVGEWRKVAKPALDGWAHSLGKDLDQDMRTWPMTLHLALNPCLWPDRRKEYGATCDKYDNRPPKIIVGIPR